MKSSFDHIREKAKEGVWNASENIAEHLPDVRKVFGACKDAENKQDNIISTRYFCFCFHKIGTLFPQNITSLNK